MSGGPDMHTTRGDSRVLVTHGSPPEVQSAADCKELVGGGGRNNHIITVSVHSLPPFAPSPPVSTLRPDVTVFAAVLLTRFLVSSALFKSR